MLAVAEEIVEKSLHVMVFYNGSDGAASWATGFHHALELAFYHPEYIEPLLEECCRRVGWDDSKKREARNLMERQLNSSVKAVKNGTGQD